MISILQLNCAETTGTTSHGTYMGTLIGGIYMRVLTLLAGLCLFAGSGNVIGAEGDFIDLSSQEIEEAIQYGKSADYELNEFGGYDLGLNKYSLGDKTGYLDFITPFVRIAGLSLKAKRSGKSLSVEEAQEQVNRPVELRVFLYVRKDELEDPIECIVETSLGSTDISGMVMEFSMCDDDTDDCVRSLAYLLPAEEVKGERAFRIIMKGETLGEKNIEIETRHIK